MAAILGRLEDLKETATKCYTDAKEIEDSMDLWAEFVYELYQGCSDNSASVEDQKRRTEQQLKLTEDDEKFRVKQETTAKAELDKMDKALTDAKDNYKKALDGMPTGMELVGGAILMGLADSAGTALNTYAAAANPIGSVGTASKGLSALVKELKDDGNTKAGKAANGTNGTTNGTTTNGTNGTTNGTAAADGTLAGDQTTKPQEEAQKKTTMLSAKLASVFVRRAKPKATDASDAQKPAGESKAEETSKPKTEEKPAEKPATADTAPAKAATYGEYDLSGRFMTDDPAFAIASAANAAIESVKNIIVGLPTGINWDAVISKDTNAPSELRTATYTLERTLKDFKAKKGALASQLLIATLTEAIGVAEELEEEAAKGSKLGSWEKPTRKSPQVKDWDERISRCHLNSTALDGAAASMPGGVGTRGASLFSPPQQTPEEKIANSNYKQSVAEQTVKSATTKLHSTQATYTATLDSYQRSTDVLRDVQGALQTTRNEIAGLKASKLSLVRIFSPFSSSMLTLA